MPEDGFFRIDAARAYEHAVFRMDFRRETADLCQLFRPKTEDRGKWHPMDVSGGRRLGCVHVSVGIEPDDTDFIAKFAVKGGKS